MSLNDITAETLAAFKKAQQTGFNVDNGVMGYDLSGLLQLIPINTPLFSSITRKVAPVGSDFANWKIMVDLSNSMPSPFTGRSAGGKLIPTSVLNASAQYVPVRISDSLDLDARDLARGYDDLAALATAYTLSTWRVLEEKALLAGQAAALPAVGTVTGTPSLTGGTLAAGTVYFRVQARSGMNYYWGGSGVASAEKSATTTGSTGSVVLTWPAVVGAWAYDVFVGGTGAEKYAGTTTVNTFTVTNAQASPASVPVMPDLFTGVPTLATVDGSFSGTNYNGLVASTLLDYGNAGQLVTTGTATPSGASYLSLDGAKLSSSGQSIGALDELFLNIYQHAQQVPNRILVSGQQGQDIKSLIMGPQSTLLELDPSGNGRSGIVAGGSVAKYLAFTGDTVDIQVSPHCPPGTIVAISDRVNFPESGIANVLESRVQRDVQEWDYGVTRGESAGGGPRKEWDVSSMETFLNRAPLACGVISNIAAGV